MSDESVFGTLWKLYRKIGSVISTIEPCVLHTEHRNVSNPVKQDYVFWQALACATLLTDLSYSTTAWRVSSMSGVGITSHGVDTHQAELARSTAPVKNENRNRHHMTCMAENSLSTSSSLPRHQASLPPGIAGGHKSSQPALFGPATHDRAEGMGGELSAARLREDDLEHAAAGLIAALEVVQHREAPEGPDEEEVAGREDRDDRRRRGVPEQGHGVGFRKISQAGDS